MKKLKLRQFTCKRCGHQWVPRIPNVVQCPACKSARWRQPKGGTQ